jgi:hypothetical protein
LGISQQKKFATEQGNLCHKIYEKIAKAKQAGVKKPKVLRKWVEMLVNVYRRDWGMIDRFGKLEKLPPLWTLSPKALAREKTCETCQHFVNNTETCWVAGRKVNDFKGCPKEEFEESAWLMEKVINDPEFNPIHKKVIDTEQVFAYDLPDEREVIKVNGIIDLVVKLDEDSIEIIDYKTGKTGVYDPYHSFFEDPQLLIYYMAARKLYEKYKNIFITIHFIKKRTGPMTFAFSDKDEQKIKGMLIARYAAIKNNVFPRRRCDRPNGMVRFDWKCEYMCNPEACVVEYDKMLKQGGVIDDEAK